MEIGKFKVTFHFLWFDMWVGVFLDQKKNIYYIGILPMCIIKIAPIK